jgi:hypothetical protein
MPRRENSISEVGVKSAVKRNAICGSEKKRLSIPFPANNSQDGNLPKSHRINPTKHPIALKRMKVSVPRIGPRRMRNASGKTETTVADKRMYPTIVTMTK